MSILERERTSAEIIMYALYLYFLGLSFRDTSKAISHYLKKKEEVMLLYGNGLKGLILNMFIVAKECQIF
jgi:hypothetical protein